MAYFVVRWPTVGFFLPSRQHTLYLVLVLHLVFLVRGTREILLAKHKGYPVLIAASYLLPLHFYGHINYYFNQKLLPLNRGLGW